MGGRTTCHNCAAQPDTVMMALLSSTETISGEE